MLLFNMGLTGQAGRVTQAIAYAVSCRLKSGCGITFASSTYVDLMKGRPDDFKDWQFRGNRLLPSHFKYVIFIGLRPDAISVPGEARR